MNRITVALFLLTASVVCAESSVALAGTGGGLFVSRDRGVTWDRIPAAEQWPVLLVAIDRTDVKRLYAATKDTLLTSQDGGDEWSSTALPVAQPVQRLLAGASSLYLLSKGQLWISPDAGQTWTQENGIPEDVLDVAIDGTSEVNVYAITRRNLYTKHGASSWMAVPSFVYGGQIGAGSRTSGSVVRFSGYVFSRTQDGGYNWTDLPLLPDEIGAEAQSAIFSGTFEVRTTTVVAAVLPGERNGEVLAFATMCLTWDGDPWGCAAGVLLFRDNKWHVAPISGEGRPLDLAVDYESSTVLAASNGGGASGLARSIDGGLNFHAMPAFRAVAVNAVAIATQPDDPELNLKE